MKNPLRLYSGLSREIYILFIARIINRMGDFVNIFLTLFLTTRIGLEKKETGFFLTLVAFFRILGVLTGGKTADLLGRKRVMVFCQSVAALFLIPCGFLGPSMAIPWLLAVSGFFSGAVRPVNGSMVADLTDRRNRKKAYSLMYMGTNLGVAVGPLIAGLLFKNHMSWIFWGDAATSLFGALLILLFIRETRPDGEEEEASLVSGPESERAERGSSLKALLARPILLIFSLLVFFTQVMYAQHSFLIPLHLEIFYAGESARLFGYLMSFNAVTVLLITAVILTVTGKNSAAVNIAGTALCYALGFGMLYFCRTLPFFFVSAFLWTIGEVLVVTNFSVYLANHSPINHRGRFNSFMQTVTGMGYVAGPWLGGLLAESLGVVHSWLVIAVFGLFTAGGLLFLDRTEKRLNARQAASVDV